MLYNNNNSLEVVLSVITSRLKNIIINNNNSLEVVLSVITSRLIKCYTIIIGSLEVVLSVITSRRNTFLWIHSNTFGSSAICDYF